MKTENNANPRVLIVHRYFWPENIAVLPLMLRDVVNIHLEKGHSVDVVCGASEDFEDQWRKEFGDRINIRHFRANLDRAQTSLGRVYCNIRLMAFAILALCSGNKRDLMYVVSYPPLLAGILVNFALVFQRCRHSVYYLQDNHLYFLERPVIVKLFRAYNRHIVSRCKAVITISAAMKAELVSRFPKSAREQIGKKIHVIPNYSTDFSDSIVEAKPYQYDILYAGNHGKAQNLYLFLDMLSTLSSEHETKPLRVGFFGNGSEKANLQSYAKSLGVSIEFNEPVSRSEVSELMTQTKMGLVGAQPGLMRYAFPSKLAAYNSAGLKALVMCETDSEMSCWLHQNELGHVIDPVDASTGANQLFEIFNKNGSEYDKNQLIDRSKQIYSKPNYLKSLDTLIDSLIVTSQPSPNSIG